MESSGLHLISGPRHAACVRGDKDTLPRLVSGVPSKACVASSVPGGGRRGGFLYFRLSVQAFDLVGRKQSPHLGNGDAVEHGEALGLCQSLPGEG